MKRCNYTPTDTILEAIDNHLDLGVCITKYLTWNKHIHQITASANRTRPFVRRSLHSCSKTSKQLPHLQSTPERIVTSIYPMLHESKILELNNRHDNLHYPNN